MANVKVDATITTGAENISLRLSGKKFRLTQNGNDWSGSRTLDLPANVSIAFRAAGIFLTPWDLSVSFSSTDGETELGKFEKNGKIPENMLATLTDAITLSAGAA
jgi:hypothetical protein